METGQYPPNMGPAQSPPTFSSDQPPDPAGWVTLPARPTPPLYQPTSYGAGPELRQPPDQMRPPGFTPPSYPHSVAPPDRVRRRLAVIASGGTVALVALSLVSLWMPWTYIGIGDGDAISFNGFTAVPEFCFFGCSGGRTSPFAYLLIAAAALTVVAELVWLITREPVFRIGAVALACSLPLLAVVNTGYLYLNALDTLGGGPDVMLLPHIGAVFCIITSSGAVVGAAVSTLAARRPRPPWQRPAPPPTSA